MYNNSSRQYPNQGYQTAYPQQYQQQGYNTAYGYHQYADYTTNQTEPGPPGETTYSNNWGTSGGATYQNEDQSDGVAQEMQQQKAQLMTQREEYVKKASVLRRELELLRDQKQDLLSDGSRDRDVEMILKENVKLQEEIQGKLKAITNVIEMLSSIIKDGKSLSDLEAAYNSARSPKTVDFNLQDKNCVVHYDTGLHWCRICDEFPETAKDLLVHLQSANHLEKVKRNDEVDMTPWHKLPPEPLLPSFDDAPKKRLPIKGLQFFISAPSWYCKLCDVWIGDLHCASHHLKSLAHFQNYENFITQNPQWEIDWIKDREKAKNITGVNDSSEDGSKSKKKKRKEKKASEDKKKKKRSKKRRKDSSDSSSSSSSSDSSSDEEDKDKSKSIRVAMRNLKAQSIMKEDLSGRWQVLEKLVEEHKKHEAVKKPAAPVQEDKLISQWMTVSEAPKKDKVLLDGLKDRMKVKQEQEKAKLAELERKRQERENKETAVARRREILEKRRKDEEERERKRREQEEYNRIIDKQRNQVKFKTFRKHRSESEEETEEPAKAHSKDEKKTRSRSRSSERRSDYKRKAPPPPPMGKRLPFIGRMPLFKNKKPEEKVERKEIQKEEYDRPRRTRFEPGNLPKAFIPRPDVVCFPKLSCIPPLMIPPPPSIKPEEPPKPPSPPKIKEKESAPPPAPKIGSQAETEAPPEQPNYDSAEAAAYADQQGGMMDMYYGDYSQMYPQQYEYPPQEENADTQGVPLSHTLPLQPPPMPPEDDLAMLGICADDMAAQSF